MNDIKGTYSDTEFSYFEPRICVIGPGWVGLDLARSFSAKYETILFNIDQAPVKPIVDRHDSTPAVPDELLQAKLQTDLTCTSDIEKIRLCNFYVVTVPAPEELNNHPDLQPLWKVCEILGKVISGGNIVVCETTLCSGVTEEACISLIEEMSGLTCHIDFFAGCSPGWSNATDKLHSAEKTGEETFRSTPEIGKIVHEIYSAIVVTREDISA